MKLYIPPQTMLSYWWRVRRQFALDRPQLGARWSNFEGRFPRPNRHGIFFTACDSEYFRLYGENYIRSVARSGGRQSVHLHIYNGSDDLLRSAERIGCACGVTVTVTRDSMADPGLYSEYLFAAGRFVVLPRLLAEARSPVICTDIDVLVRGSIDASVADLASCDIGLHIRPASSLPWRKVLASTVIAMPTPAAEHYFCAVASALEAILTQPLRHHVDQMILYFAYRVGRRKGPRQVDFAPVAKALIDWEFEEDSLIWNAKGPERKDAYREAAQRMFVIESWGMDK